ncbi:putative thiol peroxidase [Propionigenium maris DSM 9537]|uniref:Thiol peroxidase n=1 Tax=Propionigenium maris DSM 9537 TaxID=1123000 RepID=A0A9W6GPJ9_9FUSO|nr:thiol peroxidase [Propionigenium maris]GLI58372.1 putative thiol peroxidase [Propionigenium maris DSM 9537]
MKVTFQGNPLTVLGRQVALGEKAPNFTAINLDLTDFNYQESDKIRVISVVPSLDTPVCSLQTTKFNMALEELEGVEVTTVSVDLPFAQARFCEDEGIKNLTVVSDYKYKDFAKKYGCFIEELHLLTRAVFVVDNNGIIKYAEYLEEITSEPNYEKALEVVRNLLI